MKGARVVEACGHCDVASASRGTGDLSVAVFAPTHDRAGSVKRTGSHATPTHRRVAAANGRAGRLTVTVVAPALDSAAGIQRAGVRLARGHRGEA